MNLPFHSVNKTFQEVFTKHWDRPAISNYQGDTYSYAQMCERIALLHIAFEKCGIAKGDKIALCGKNQANWAVACMAALTYGATAVPILHEFNPESVSHLLEHSEAKMFFVDELIWQKMTLSSDNALSAVVRMNDLDFLMSREEGLRNQISEEFKKRYPEGFRPSDVSFYEDQPEDMALLNYTSGTSGFSKGAMIPYRALFGNLLLARTKAEPQMNYTHEMVSMLPCAHMYGLMFEVLHTFYVGAHVHFLTKAPSPSVILGAFQNVHPQVIIAVPLIIEKVYRSKIKPVTDKYKVLLAIPGLRQIVYAQVRKQVTAAFGGEFEEVILGGAALNPEVEKFLHKCRFRFTVGYGMTETAPLIAYQHWNEAKVGSCGKVVDGCEVRIDSTDPSRIPGEVQVKGDNVFLGYYKNEEASKECFTDDGWFRTGDMGILKNGYVYLRGRSKCMILTANGQNIYPEELEGVINNVDYVADSLVVDDHGVLTAIIFPDYVKAEKDGMNIEAIQDKLTQQLPEINKSLPLYAQVKKIEFLLEDFERTPKKSIRRYKYQK